MFLFLHSTLYFYIIIVSYHVMVLYLNFVLDLYAFAYARHIEYYDDQLCKIEF